MIEQLKHLKWDQFFGWFRNACGIAAGIIFYMCAYAKPKMETSKSVAEFLFWLIVMFVVFGALAALTKQGEDEQ